MEKALCFICQDYVGHATSKCPFARCKTCGASGHLSKTCSVKKTTTEVKPIIVVKPDVVKPDIKDDWEIVLPPELTICDKACRTVRKPCLTCSVFEASGSDQRLGPQNVGQFVSVQFKLDALPHDIRQVRTVKRLGGLGSHFDVIEALTPVLPNLGIVATFLVKKDLVITSPDALAKLFLCLGPGSSSEEGSDDHDQVSQKGQNQAYTCLYPLTCININPRTSKLRIKLKLDSQSRLERRSFVKLQPFNPLLSCLSNGIFEVLKDDSDQVESYYVLAEVENQSNFEVKVADNELFGVVEAFQFPVIFISLALENGFYSKLIVKFPDLSRECFYPEAINSRSRPFWSKSRRATHAGKCCNDLCAFP